MKVKMRDFNSFPQIGVRLSYYFIYFFDYVVYGFDNINNFCLDKLPN